MDLKKDPPSSNAWYSTTIETSLDLGDKILHLYRKYSNPPEDDTDYQELTDFSSDEIKDNHLQLEV